MEVLLEWQYTSEVIAELCKFLGTPDTKSGKKKKYKTKGGFRTKAQAKNGKMNGL